MGTAIGRVPSVANSQNGATFPGYDANIRNLNETQLAVTDRVPLLIDGKRSQGAFNNLYPELWDAEQSRIRARNLGQKFTGRIIVEATPKVAGSILTLDIDVSPNANPLLIYREDVELFKLEKTPITKLFVFFVSQTFLNNGGRIHVSCDNPVALTNVSLYLKMTGGHV